MNPPDSNTTEALLKILRERFYHNQHNLFHRDRKRLLHAVTWPALWLEQRGLAVDPQRYQKLIIQRLDEIKLHGDSKLYQIYFPAYLLKSIQDWFRHHGQDLYNDLKHVRNSLFDIQTLIQNLQQNEQPTWNQNQQNINDLARVHRIIKPQKSKNKKTVAQQLKLWG